MKIPNEAITDCYKYSKEAYENNLKSKDAAERIVSKHNLKLSLSKDYFNYFKYLITGTGSCRSLSSYTQGYYLENINEEYSKEQFVKSLAAFKKLIEKFEGDKVGSKKVMKAIYEKYSKLV